MKSFIELSVLVDKEINEMAMIIELLGVIK